MAGVGAQLSQPFAGMDTAKVAGLMVIGGIVVLGLLRKSFGGVMVKIGD